MSANAQPVIALLTAVDEDIPPGLEALEGRARLIHTRTVDELRAALDEADILLVTDFNTDVVERAWPAARKVRWVHATSAGVDRLLFPALRESDIPLTNARGIFDRPIAEYVLGLILTYAKDLHTTRDLQRAHRWQHRDTERIEGQRALVVGAGSIGRQIARACGAMGMQVTGIASRDRDDDPDFQTVYGNDRLQAVLPEQDYVVIAAPLTPATKGLFDEALFRHMAGHARLINIGRGPIVRTDDLVAALQAGELAGAALDVFEEEPLPADHPLWAMDNVIISHHMAGDVVGWRRALSEQFIANLERWQQGEALHNQVDKGRGYVPPTP